MSKKTEWTILYEQVRDAGFDQSPLGLARLVWACEVGDLNQHIAPDLWAVIDELATPRARVAELVRKQAEETDEFNAGFDAFQRGEPVTAEPFSTPYDVWVMGWAWAQYRKQVTA